MNVPFQTYCVRGCAPRSRCRVSGTCNAFVLSLIHRIGVSGIVVKAASAEWNERYVYYHYTCCAVLSPPNAATVAQMFLQLCNRPSLPCVLNHPRPPGTMSCCNSWCLVVRYGWHCLSPSSYLTHNPNSPVSHSPSRRSEPVYHSLAPSHSNWKAIPSARSVNSSTQHELLIASFTCRTGTTWQPSGQRRRRWWSCCVCLIIVNKLQRGGGTLLL